MHKEFPENENSENLWREFYSPKKHSFKNYKGEDLRTKFENPTVLQYYIWLYKTGHTLPKHLPFSLYVSELRKEASLLAQIFMGAKDYETFFKVAAWARDISNEDLFVKVIITTNNVSELRIF